MDILVSALVQSVLQNLGSVSLQEIGVAWGFKNELENLESVLNTIQLVLKDAEVKQRKSQALHGWLQKLKSAAYDAENILDEVVTEGLMRTVDSERGNFRKLDVFFSHRNPVLFKLRISAKVKKIRERLDVIADERLKFHLGEGLVLDNRIGYMVGDRQTGSFVNELEIYGRNEEKDMIVDKLVGGNCDRGDLSVYAVCGMGGIGKTTLAQLVYNDERVEAHFDLRIWVCVSDDFSIPRLIRAIIESSGAGGCSVSELDPLQRFLQESLMGRRYLLVLDDVWNENPIVWDGLKQTLECGLNGSVVMVTSRIEKVAIMMAAVSTHHVQYLSEDDSWSIFSRRAFTTGATGERYTEEIGKEIVRKCGGVPLAVKALGSLMRYKSGESEWLAIQESEIWQLIDDENCVLPALKLSYDNLPLHLRQCFVYCCVFPKDYEMDEENLIQLWMANGFVSFANETNMYLNGRLIFKELVWRSFLQDVRKGLRGTVVCKMHDLMHDLAQSVMRHETCVIENGRMISFPRTLRHLSFMSCGVVQENGKKQLKLPINRSLRSFIGHGKLFPYAEDLSVHLAKQKYLRVLDLNYMSRLDKLPDIICKWIHLRYLAMDCDCLKRLPESLIRLQKLQTLKLSSTGYLVELPKGMKYLKELCFLDIGECPSLVSTPPGLGELTRLQMLSTFIVGPDSAHHIDQLKDLNLGGELSIRGLDHVRTFEGAKSANLMAKVNLTSLGLSWMKGIKEDDENQFEEVIEGLEPNQNLEKIHIKLYQGSRFPKWMSTLSFENLYEVTIDSCRKCEHLPPLGRLPSLKCLKLYKLDSVKRLDAEWYGVADSLFPALTSFSLSGLHNLEEWSKPVSENSFPSLTELHIRGCPKLLGLPCISTLKSLVIEVDNNMALLGSITGLTSITSLVLCNHTSELDVLPQGLLQNHTALSSLQICSGSIKTLSNALDNLSALHRLGLSCRNLEFLPDDLSSLNSLEYLGISSCDSLVSIPANLFQGMSSLRDISIQNCKKLKYPLSGTFLEAPNLQSLLINGCPELELLPDSIEQLTDLRSLGIWHCERLCSLPNRLGTLESLSEMKIWYCKNLKSLPDSFQSLKALKKLSIEGCPLLERRCKKPKGEDWPKVSHIPEVCINTRTAYIYDSHPIVKACKQIVSCT